MQPAAKLHGCAHIRLTAPHNGHDLVIERLIRLEPVGAFAELFGSECWLATRGSGGDRDLS